MEIQDKQSLEMHNVLTCKGDFTRREFMAKKSEIAQIIRDAGLEQTGAMFSCREWGVDGAPGHVALELLIPLNQEFSPPSGYHFLQHFQLNDAVKLHYVGHPAKLQNAKDTVNEYMNQRGLKPLRVYTKIEEPTVAQIVSNSVTTEIYFDVSRA